MVWYSPPTRRELSLAFFALTVFVLFYNLETSFTIGGSQETSSGDQTVDWDRVIYGNWTWEEKLVSENAQKKATNKTSGAPTAVSFHPHVFGTVGVNDGIRQWGDNVPTTTVLKHVPGYTVMDNLFMLNGTLFVVTDDPSFPPLDSIASSREDSHIGPRPLDWQILSGTQAKQMLGPFGGFIHGVSWLVMDASPSNYTFLSLWRTYSALDMTISSDALTLPPPRRVFYPNVPTFVGEQPDKDGPIVSRQRSPSGFHPFLVKAAFPTLGLMYKEDWDDYALLHAPYVIQRAVVADQGAARRGRMDLPPCAVPLVVLQAAEGWWEPIRRNVARFVDVPEEAPKSGWLSKPEMVVTYLTRQNAVGPNLRKADHEELVGALKGLGKGYTVQIVAAEASWVERMRAIAQSTIVVGVYGTHMADAVYIPPSKRAMVVEMFPPEVFIQDTALSVRAVGVQYVAWRGGRQYGVNVLPPDAPPGDDNVEVPVDVPTLIQAIRRTA